ncbi:pyridoxal phosphate-dependent decarboxylase family protein [Actinocatenispora thailandica]|uniref:pyridoxal phosphate-dependent decarboxylase family protein n=1 Tax=Actinocatenispora thailandica TaxID=227318 RepID=UPI001950314B|nr:pyridoxal-dependent decarboxylase [Actinocatenispora thailandica]
MILPDLVSASAPHPVRPPSPTPPIDQDQLAGTPAGLARLAPLTAALATAAAAGLRGRTGPLPARTPADLAEQVRADLAAAGGVLPDTGRGAAAVVDLIRRYAAGTVDLADPTAAAHLQPPALGVPAAVEAIVAALNASVDTWDSGPYAVELERHVVRALADRLGLPGTADGVFTSGGTASNLHALLIARDAVAGRLAAGGRPVVFCSAVAHFSVSRACSVLGLGADAVRTVPVDERYRLRPEPLADALAGLAGDEVPVAIVATAGTTDFGSIDPLPACADLARRHGCRLHVDAAYGGGAVFSARLRGLLTGIAAADSVTLDLHKVGWQPAPASVLLVADGADFAPHRVDYLNPADDGAAGYDGLLDRSALATTRRADAVKVAATFLALGADGLGALLDRCHHLARYAQRRIEAEPRLELAAGATLTTVVFRHRGADPDALNGRLRRRLLRSGVALVGRTTIAGRGVHLKLTLLNPAARTEDVDELVDAVLAAGDEDREAA